MSGFSRVLRSFNRGMGRPFTAEPEVSVNRQGNRAKRRLTMSVLDDIADALNRYPEDETAIQVINVARANGSNDSSVNACEVWDFQVKLTNNGHVDMTNVSLHILGLAGTKVRVRAQPQQQPDAFVTGIIAGNLNPGGGGGTSTSEVFQFKAPP